MNENPMLEALDADPNLPEETEDDEEQADPNRPTEDERELVVQDNQSNTEDFERLANMDSDYARPVRRLSPFEQSHAGGSRSSA